MATDERSGTVTILFTDLVASTELLSRLGDEDFERLRRIHFRLLRDAVATSGGEEVKNLGDGLMVVFPSALDAIGCAVAMQQGVALHNVEPEVAPIEVRVGVHAGEPIRDEDDYFGTPVVVAKRLCDTASGGQIVVSELVAALVGGRRQFSFRSLGDLQLKGVGQPLSAREVMWRDDDLSGDAYEVSPVGAPGAEVTSSAGITSRKNVLIAAAVAVVVLLVAGAVWLTGGDRGDGGTDAAGSGEQGQPLVSEGDGGLVEAPDPAPAGTTNETGDELPDAGFGSLGNIESPGEAQEFTVTLGEGDLVSWLVTPVEPGGLGAAYIELTNGAGELVGFDENGQAVGAPAIWQFRVPATGGYTARVSSTDANGSGRYEFEVFYDDELFDGREPVRGVGSLGGSDSSGVWEVELAADDLVSIFTESHATERLEFDLKLVAPGGEVVVEVPYENEFPPYIENLVASETGTYQLVFEPAGAEDAGVYQFEVIWQ